MFIVSNESPCYGNNIKEYCYENTFRLCRGIELNRSCGYNYLSECHNMTLGNNNYLNILFQCENTVFGNKCSYNNFMCVKSSTLKNDCEHNVICKIGVDTPNSAAFDYEPHFISLDDGCYGNVINSEMDDFIKNGNTT